MNTAALAMLQDLARSRKLLRRGKDKGLSIRPLKKRASGGPKSRHTVRMNGLGEISQANLIREAEVAVRLFMTAAKHADSKNWDAAIDMYFKAAAVATNVIFSSNVNAIKLPEKLIHDMNIIIAGSTAGIKEIMKSVADKVMIIHVSKMHRGAAKAAAARKGSRRKK